MVRSEKSFGSTARSSSRYLDVASREELMMNPDPKGCDGRGCESNTTKKLPKEVGIMRQTTISGGRVMITATGSLASLLVSTVSLPS
jgi:hypothetical protein